MKTRFKLLEEAIKERETAKIKQIKMDTQVEEETATFRIFILLVVLASLVWLANL